MMNRYDQKSATLAGLPVEILLDIYQHLDLDSIFELSIASTHLHNIFTQSKATILVPVLRREFSPFDELLQVHTATANDLDATNGSYRSRTIVFKRFPGDREHDVVMQPSYGARFSNQVGKGFVQVSNGQKLRVPFALAPDTLVLTGNDLDPLLRKCKLVRKWEELFPQMRWFHQPENCRSLRLHEMVRFRRALYRWWLYGIYFHGELPRPRIGLPEPNVPDIRTSQMRYHSTSQLLELMDLLETMKDVILHYICPRLDPNQYETDVDVPVIDQLDRVQSLTTGWNDQSRWGRIVKTYAKLGPEELLYYFENIYSYPRKRLIDDIRLRRPNFTFDQESIQTAIRCALDERQWMEKAPSLAEENAGGIIDFDDERDNERLAFGNDASSNGMLPPGSKIVRSFSQYSPRGDDGSCLEDSMCPTGRGNLYMTSSLLSIVR